MLLIGTDLSDLESP